MSTKITTITNIADLEQLVLAWEAKFFEPGLGYPLVWYRGQGRDLPPQPGILRPPFSISCDNDEVQILPKRMRLWRKEVTINLQFRRMAASHVVAGSTNTHLYFLAQHHGLPTRLLDWTMNPLAALYFAASGSPDEDGVIFVINPKDLGEPLDLRDERITSTTNALFDGKNIPFDAQILPLMPDLIAGRMFQQSSCFTLHTPVADLAGGGQDATQSLEIPKLEKLIVPKARKSDLVLTLRRLNVNKATIFPDLDHVAEELRAAWKL